MNRLQGARESPPVPLSSPPPRIDMMEGSQRTPANRRVFAQYGSATSPASSGKASKMPIVNPYSSRKRFRFAESAPSLASAEISSIENGSTEQQAGRSLAAGFVNPYLQSTSKASSPNSLEAVRQQEDHYSDDLRMYFTDSFDLFFATLLRSSVNDYVEAEKSECISEQLWKTLCGRVRIPVPVQRIQPIYDDPKAHFDIRAALVLEEARDAISKSLAKRWNRPKRNSHWDTETDIKESTNLRVHMKHSEPRKHDMTVLTFQALMRDDAKGKPKYFTAEQKENLCYGVIFECIPEAQKTNIASAILGCMLPTSAERIHRQGSFDVLVFQPLTAGTGLSWKLTPVDNFLCAFRQFVAVTVYAAQVPFIDALLGKEETKSTVATEQKEPGCPSDRFNTVSPLQVNDSRVASEQRMSSLEIPDLNATQEKAVTSFLASPPNSITLIQGPPGTGKTTCLVATICQWLIRGVEDNGRSRCIVVCAPTNKAVSVLATRFVKACESSYVNIAVVGDRNRLLGTEAAKSSPVLPYFVYNFQEMVEEEFNSVLKFVSSDLIAEAKQKATSLHELLFRRLLELPMEFKANCEALCSAFNDDRIDKQTLIKYATDARNAFAALASDAVLYDLVRSSEVIFCTLCTAGSKLLQQVPAAEALIIDEAAAATEADVAIPFHLFHGRPARLLAVGDPKQLPSVVLSNRAKRFGLDVSLHERLMYRGSNCIMLDIQYRMHPAISAFPSNRFYASKLLNGQNVTALAYGQRSRLILNDQPYVFLQLDGGREEKTAGSLCNHREADVVVNLTRQLICRSNPDRLRVITFYSAQVELLRKKLNASGMKDVLVTTVDSSQGCESDVVIVSFVRTESAGFLTDDRRMNVALTRARHQLVCVGKVDRFPLFDRARTLHELAANAQARQVVTHFQSVQGQNEKRNAFHDNV